MGEGTTCSSKPKESKARSSTFVPDTRESKVSGAPLLLRTPSAARGNFNYIMQLSESYNNIGKGITKAARWVRSFSTFQKTGGTPYNTDVGRCEDGSTSSLTENGVYASIKNGTALQVKGTSSCSRRAVRVQYGDVCCSSECTTFLQTTPLELVVNCEKVRRDLCQLDLQAPLPPGKTNWEVIPEVHALLKPTLTVLESIVSEVNDKYDFYKACGNHKCQTRDYVEDNEDMELYEGLCKSFDDVSREGMEHCLQAINLVANCIEECQEITDSVPIFLLQAALDFVDTCNRITRAQEHMIMKKKSAVYVIEWSLQQEEKRATHVWKLVETVSCYVVVFQNRVLQLAVVQMTRNFAQNEATSNLKSRMHQSWTWLNRISERLSVLCISRKHDLFVCLLETFVQTAEELCHFQELVLMFPKGKKKRLPAGAASSFQKLLLSCLDGLFWNAEEVLSELKRIGLVSDCEYPQVSDAADVVSRLLTLLLSKMPQLTGTTVLESSEAALKSGSRLIPLTKEYLEIVLSLVCKNAAPTTEGIKEKLKSLCRDLNKIHSELKDTMQVTVDSDSSTRLIDFTLTNQEELNRGPSSSANVEAPIQPPRALTKKPSQKRAKPSAFANRATCPVIKAPDVNPAVVVDTGLASNANGAFVYEGFPSEGADPSLDRIPPPMPDPVSFDRVNSKTMTEVKHLGSGNSGVVTLMKLNNINVVVKESVCPDPNRARHRLDRECTVHARINSHCNIVRFLGRCVKTDEFGEDQVVGIITEWCPFGDLSSAIKDAAWIQELDFDGQDISSMNDRVGYRLYKSWINRLEVVADVAAGIAYMHKHYIVHRDLTCKHVLFDAIGGDGELRVKVCDFERGYYLPGGHPIQRTNAPANSPPWMGPEVLNHEKYGLKADVYSIGTLLWQLMYLENPWTHLKKRCVTGSTAIVYLLSTGKLSLSISEEDAPAGVPEFPELVRLVIRAWARDPTDRPSMAEFQKEVMAICARMKERVRQNGQVQEIIT